MPVSCKCNTVSCRAEFPRIIKFPKFDKFSPARFHDFVTLVRNNTALRSLSLSLGATFDELNQYGCWCYFEQDHGMGHRQLKKYLEPILSQNTSKRFLFFNCFMAKLLTTLTVCAKYWLTVTIASNWMSARHASPGKSTTTLVNPEGSITYQLLALPTTQVTIAKSTHVSLKVDSFWACFSKSLWTRRNSIKVWRLTAGSIKIKFVTLDQETLKVQLHAAEHTQNDSSSGPMLVRWLVVDKKFIQPPWWSVVPVDPLNWSEIADLNYWKSKIEKSINENQ